MNAFAHRAPLALSFVYLASVLAGCNAGATSPAIPPNSAQSQFTRPQANAGGIKIWAAAEQSNKVFGLSSGAKRVLDVISTESQPVKGGDPLTLKVDRAKNLFVTDVTGGKAGVIQEYKDGKFTRSYSPDCAVSNCSSFKGVLSDNAVDDNHVFAIMKQIQYKVGTYTVSGSGYEYWPNGNPSATPVQVLLSSDCSEVCFYDAGDVDSSGNLWLRDFGGGGYGVAEITNPSTRPSMNQILPFTFTINSGDIAGFYISNAGTVLNVGDSSHKIYQYALPLTYGGSPFNTLTPCSQGCDPHGFGFNSNDKLIVAGDGKTSGSGSPYNGFLDLGQVSKNRWKQVSNRRFTAPFSSAVYTPSDK
ncbi:MAG TPA: hypothetical protein VK755_15920 [Candidatus Acidoferrales bacterium]|jgi:hypothetical protein|nr:hypothetical protein [Candidatus Acidoferrales bacterium]